MMSEWLAPLSDIIVGVIWITCGIYWLKKSVTGIQKSPNYLLCIAIIINFIGILFLLNGIFSLGG